MNEVLDVKYRGRKNLIQSKTHDGLGVNRYFTYHVMPFGKERRKAILDHLKSIENDDHNYIVINRKYCLILKKDPDLKRLLKQGKLRMDKICAGGNKCTYSVLRLVEDKI